MRLFWFLFFFCFTHEVLASEGVITVYFSKAELVFHDENSTAVSFPVGLPRKTPKLPVTGKVAGVEENPFWRPTPGTREAYLRKHGKELPALLRPGEKENAMGKGKINITWSDPGVISTIKIHGTNDETSIGGRVSRGCIRMKNDDVLRLMRLIEGRDIAVLFTE